MAGLIPSQPKYIVAFHDQPLYNGHFQTTASFFESQGWPLYTGLTVQSNLRTATTLGTPKNGRCSKGGHWTKVVGHFCTGFSGLVIQAGRC
jgi:hypothetical protein